MDELALPPLPILPDDLLGEILLRVPPEPIHLFRASLVSRQWRGLVHDAGFLRRFREFHGGTPPVLGFFSNRSGSPLFVPTASSSASTAAKMSYKDWWAIDCRHGRALLERRHPWALVVWDLVTSDKCYLPMHPAPVCEGVWNGAVLRAAGHADRRSCPFLVVYVSSLINPVICACVYSSEKGVWSEITSITTPYVILVDAKPALVGNTLYWLSHNFAICEFDTDNHRLGLTEMIPHDMLCSYGWKIVIMPTNDGLLGLAGVQGLNLHLWSMVKRNDGLVTWTRQRVIDLKKLLPPQVVATCMEGARTIGFAEEADVIFIYVHSSIYMVHLKSMQIDEVPEKGAYGSIYPYTSFYSPGITIHGGHDKAELLNNS